MKKIFSICMVLVTWSGFAFSGEKSPAGNKGTMGWQDVYVSALENNPSIKESEKSLEQAKLNYYASFSNFLPQVSLSAGESRSGDALANGYSAGVSGRLSLFSGFANIAGTERRHLDFKIASENYRRTFADEVYNLRKSFINLLAAQETVRLAKNICERRMKNYELIKLRYEAGREDKGSYKRVEADKFQIETELNQYARNLKVAAAQLCRDMGMDGYEVPSVTGNFVVKEPDIDFDYETLMKRIPEYLIASYRLEEAKAGVVSARSSLFPSLSLSASSSMRGDDFPPDDLSWSAGLSLSFPLFTGGRNLMGVKTAQINRKMYELSLSGTAQQLRASLVHARNSLLSSIENVNAREKYMEASREQSEITTMKYLNGLVTYYEWYNVENDYINAQKASLNAKSDALLAEAAWKKLLGIGE